MPSYDDYVRDYWAPDREQVLAQMAAQQPAAPAAPHAIADQQIRDAYGTYLGRDPNADEYSNWRDTYDFRNQIASSPEARYAVANARGELGPSWQYSSYNPANQPAGAAGTPAGGTGGGGANAFRDAWLQSGGRTVADLQNFVQSHPEFGATLGGSKGDKVYGPGGTYWADAVLAAGEGGKGAAWMTDSGGGGGTSGGAGYGGSSFERAPNPQPFNYDPFQAPAPFSYKAFDAPTGLTEENDPGFQARLALGQQGLERSAAARGTLLTGGTLKDLNQYAQDYASNEFGNVYNRALTDYTTNRGNEFQNYTTNYQNALDAYKTNFDTKFQPWQTGYNQAYQSWLGNFNAANQGFQNTLASEGQRYNQLYGAAALGLQATGQYGQAAQGYGNSLSNIYGNYGNQGSDLYTGQGNANAAGRIGQGTAWGNALTGIGNAALYTGLYMNQNR